MAFLPEYINYKDTGKFSPIVIDYTQHTSELDPFISHQVTIEGIKDAIRDKQFSTGSREILVTAVNEQYEHIDISQATSANIQSLLNTDTYTVTTAHQPNIFTGHLYFIYKIAHAIRLARELDAAMPAKKFVPVFYMGSEDADLDELGSITIEGTHYKWETDQKGAVGQMKVDDKFINLIERIEGHLSVQPNGKELIRLLRSVYRKGETIEQSTFKLINSLFGEYGLIVLLPGAKTLKATFSPVIEKELSEQFSSKAVATTIAAFPKKYKVQAQGRDINLFYLKDDIRERIEKTNDGYSVANTDINFTNAQILNELKAFPERFSPNVILRPLYQEMILPNVAFIGGGGELAYWLELKNIFQAMQVPFPVIVLRNSFMVVSKELQATIDKLGLNTADLFLPQQEMIRKVLVTKSINRLDLSVQLEKLRSLYAEVNTLAGAIDVTLIKHVEALCHQSEKKMKEVEKKMLRAEKRMNEADMRNVEKIRTALFPSEGLQERTDNFMPYYARFGSLFIEAIINSSKGLSQKFTILSEQ